MLRIQIELFNMKYNHSLHHFIAWRFALIHYWFKKSSDGYQIAFQTISIFSKWNHSLRMWNIWYLRRYSCLTCFGNSRGSKLQPIILHHHPTASLRATARRRSPGHLPEFTMEEILVTIFLDPLTFIGFISLGFLVSSFKMFQGQKIAAVIIRNINKITCYRE